MIAERSGENAGCSLRPSMLLDFSSLAHYDWLDVPLWVFDPERQCNLWANAAALRFWRAGSAEEFLGRDFAEQCQQWHRCQRKNRKMTWICFCNKRADFLIEFSL